MARPRFARSGLVVFGRSVFEQPTTRSSQRGSSDWAGRTSCAAWVRYGASAVDEQRVINVINQVHVCPWWRDHLDPYSLSLTLLPFTA